MMELDGGFVDERILRYLWTHKKQVVGGRRKNERTQKEKLVITSIIVFEVHYFRFQS